MLSTIHLGTCLVLFAGLLGHQPVVSIANVRGLRASTTTRLLLAELSVPTAGRYRPASVASKGATACAAGLAGVLAAPHTVLASAQESLDLLDGYQALTPEWATWTVLLGGGVWLYFRVFKFLASF